MQTTHARVFEFVTIVGRLLDRAAEPSWDSFVQAAPGGTFFPSRCLARGDRKGFWPPPRLRRSPRRQSGGSGCSLALRSGGHATGRCEGNRISLQGIHRQRLANPTELVLTFRKPFTGNAQFAHVFGMDPVQPVNVVWKRILVPATNLIGSRIVRGIG